MQGELGQNALKGPFAVNVAVSEFSKKFKEKTRNDWANRDNFQPVPGKYTLIEVGEFAAAPSDTKPSAKVLYSTFN